MATLDLIAGARPNFMKIASIIRALHRATAEGGLLRYRLVHTGQHYDHDMSASFFGQLGIPEPHINLAAGSGTQAEQTASIMVRYERVLLSEPSAMCIVVGDVTSTLACAVAARKLGVPVAHVEAGIRSGDWNMPEEINRIVTDAVSNYFFTTSETAGANLRASGVSSDRIFFVGNTMIDTLLANMERLRPPQFWSELALKPREYVVATLHRPSNVDSPIMLQRYLDAICSSVHGLPVILPLHPRTALSFSKLVSIPDGLTVVSPQPYLEFNYLVRHARAVLTDSGGVTEETTVMGVPCMTLRDSTERPETVTVGTNELLGSDPSAIPAAMERLFAGRWKKGRSPDLWDGQAGARIVVVLERLLGCAPVHASAAAQISGNRS